MAGADAFDVAIVGGGAAGVATACFLHELAPACRVVVLEGAKKPGAKILVSGGGRCNVTNVSISERDFWGGSPPLIRGVLRAFTVAQTIDFFRALGVPLHEEANGKLFPDSNRARDVLDALLDCLRRSGISLFAGHRVVAVARTDDGFLVETTSGSVRCARLVLATGGRSLPKSGSDGAGYAFAEALGHTIVPQTPALAPMRLDAEGTRFAARVTGIAHGAEVTVWTDQRVRTRVTGSLLWTHFGISGPAALDASRHWARSVLEQRETRVTLNFLPGASFDAADRRLQGAALERPRASIATVLSEWLPGAIGHALVDTIGIDGRQQTAQMSRDDRRRLAHALVEWPLAIVDTRGYTYAEATAGGVSLDEIDAGTLQSRRCRGLYFVGEILDVDGRLGGFNFQWAWSSARVVARALAEGW